MLVPLHWRHSILSEVALSNCLGYSTTFINFEERKIMPISKILPYYIYDDLQDWEGRWELIDGIPYAMSPSPIPKHQRISGSLYYEFRRAMNNCKSCIPYMPLDYLLTIDTILQPDFLIVCGDVKKKYLDFNPSLIAEVLSPSTALKDRHTKFGLYEQQGIKYYLIISPDIEEVEVYELENGQYKLMVKEHSFS